MLNYIYEEGWLNVSKGEEHHSELNKGTLDQQVEKSRIRDPGNAQRVKCRALMSRAADINNVSFKWIKAGGKRLGDRGALPYPYPLGVLW